MNRIEAFEALISIRGIGGKLKKSRSYMTKLRAAHKTGGVSEDLMKSLLIEAKWIKGAEEQWIQPE